MNAGLVGERIFTNNGFIAGRAQAGDVRHEPARRIQPGRVDPGFDAEEILAGPDGHHDFLERTVAGAFADAVDRTFDLSGAGLHGGE